MKSRKSDAPAKAAGWPWRSWARKGRQIGDAVADGGIGDGRDAVAALKSRENRKTRKGRKTGDAVADGVSAAALPRHIAIIMDGNGRWASSRGLPRSAGHAAGAETFRRIATYCKDIGIMYLTVYAFSTENWKRPEGEISVIMELLEKYLGEALEKMERDRVRMRFFGDTSVLSQRLRSLIAETEELSKRYEGVQVNVCVNYGGRDEILRAAGLYAADIASGFAGKQSGASAGGSAAVGMQPDEETFSRYFYSSGIPDPDLVIRPSGEMRLSNFLLWQSAYSELYFTDILWPDFNERELDRAIAAYRARDRRFGAVAPGPSR